MAVADLSLSSDLDYSDMNASAVPPRTLSPIRKSMRSLSLSSNHVLPLIDQVQGKSNSRVRTEAQLSSLVTETSDFLPADLLTTLKRQSLGRDVAAGQHSPADIRQPLLKAGRLVRQIITARLRCTWLF